MIKNTIIDVISKEEYEINTKKCILNIINDRKILEIASFANNYYKNKLNSYHLILWLEQELYHLI